MKPRRVAVLGGGPAGLFAARLLALDHPDWTVTLWERLPPGETFGFGVGLTNTLEDELAAADPTVHADIGEAAFGFAGAEFRLPTGNATLGQWHSGALSRAALLEILTARALEVGVELRRESASIDEIAAAADLVIAADGVSSATRVALAEQLGADEQLGRGVFIWCGCRTALPGTVFQPVTTPAGTFVAHAYPHGERWITLVIETDTESLARAECVTDEFAEDGDSDETSLRYLSEAFEDLLGGQPLVGNRSRWMHFRTITCRRWHSDRVVLLGDARATVHPSLGSGTKVALEDAIALRDALRDALRSGDEDLPAQLATFERRRRPAVERLQDRARRSQLWWESFPTRMHLTPARIAVGYLSRAGAVSLDELLRSSPDLARQAAADWAGVRSAEVPDTGLSEWIIDRAGAAAEARGANGTPAISVDCRDPWSPDADELVERAASLADRGPRSIELRGGGDRSDVLDRLALGERLRTQLGVTVTTRMARSDLADAADGLVAGRTDLVRFED